MSNIAGSRFTSGLPSERIRRSRWPVGLLVREGRLPGSRIVWIAIFLFKHISKPVIERFDFQRERNAQEGNREAYAKSPPLYRR